MKLFLSSLINQSLVQPDYEPEANTLFARFTNTYTTTEKNDINTLILELKTEGIWDKIDHMFIGAMRFGNEQLLDWKDATNTIIKTSENVIEVPYRGLSPQTGYYNTNINPSTDINMSADNGFVCFKAFQDYKLPYQNYYFGANGLGTFRLKPATVGGTPKNGYALDFMSSAPYYVQLPTEVGYSDAVVFSRNLDSITWYVKGVQRNTLSSTRTNVPNADIMIGGIIATNGQSNNNPVQCLITGGGLTDTQAITLTNLIDDFCNKQSALSPYLQGDGYKVYTYNVDFKCVMGEKCVYTDFDKIYTSDDLGVTVRAETAFNYSTLGNIETCYIFDNEKVIFTTIKNKVYKTTLDLEAVTEITPTKNGNPYILHTPVNNLYPGEYYKHLGALQKQYLGDGTEIFVWGNYCNVWKGASPVVIWYSFGDEIKVAFEYGQNPYLRDNGSFIPIARIGNLLGDASETILTRHNHLVSQRPDSPNTFYVASGDYDRAAVDTWDAFYECKIIQLDYNPTLDTWSRSLVIEDSLTTRVKMTSGQMPGDGYFYYSSDANNVEGNSTDDGYWRSTYANLSNLSLHERVYLQQSTERPLNLFHYDGVFTMGGGYAAGNQPFGLFGDPDIIWSDDAMATFNEAILPIAGNSYFYRITKISTKKNLLNAMCTYSYTGGFSVVLDFN